jgi:hypothetical protein
VFIVAHHLFETRKVNLTKQVLNDFIFGVLNALGPHEVFIHGQP